MTATQGEGSSMTIDTNELRRLAKHDLTSGMYINPLVEAADEIDRLRALLTDSHESEVRLIAERKRLRAQLGRAGLARQEQIDRLSGIADGAVQNGMDNESLRFQNANLRALLTEARGWVRRGSSRLWPGADDGLLARIDAALDGGSGSVAHQEWESGVAWERHADALDGGVCATCNGTGEKVVVRREYVRDGDVTLRCPDCSGVSS